jgi:enterochelin esterase-like enzyme
MPVQPSRTTPRAAATAIPATTVTSDAVDFRLPHAPGVQGVRLELDFSVVPTDPELRRDADLWSLHLPRPAVDRMEYQFTVRSADGVAYVLDPSNPRTVSNPFGDKSEIIFPDYSEPHWLSAPERGTVLKVSTPAAALETAVPISLWSPEGLDMDAGAPLLVANDGSDLAGRGGLLRWAAEAARARPFRVALLDPPPGLRDQWYAADPTYADHLSTIVLPALENRVAVEAVVGLGASLGALAMLFAQRRHPELLDAMVLQSGSYFTLGLDAQERGYPRFDQVCSAVMDLIAGPAVSSGGMPTSCEVLMTCGTVEENRPNNEKMADALGALGYRVQLDLQPDAHTMIGWRNAWSPRMDALLHTVGRRPGR